MPRDPALDRAYRGWRAPMPPLAYGPASALVCVGFQEIWRNRWPGGGGSLRDAGEFRARLEGATARARRVLAAWRVQGGLVCHVSALPREDHRPFAGRDLRQVIEPVHDWAADAAFLEGLEPCAGEPVVFPLSTNPLLDRSLETILRNAGVEEMILAGVPGHLVVQNIARSSHDLGLGCAVVDDAIASWRPEEEAAGLEALERVYCHVVETEGVVQALAGSGLSDRAGSQDDPASARRLPRGQGTPAAAPREGDMPRVTAGNTALLCIDVQYGSAHPAFGGIARARARGIELEEYVTALEPAVCALRGTQEFCRRRGVEVIHIHIESLTRDGRDRCRGHKVLANLKARGSIDGRILDPVAPEGDEIVLAKSSSSAFANGQLAYLLRNLGKTCLLIGGVVTSGCVESTVRDALAEGFTPLLIDDACAAWCDGLHRMAVESMRALGIRVIRSDELPALLEESRTARAAGGGAA